VDVRLLSVSPVEPHGVIGRKKRQARVRPAELCRTAARRGGRQDERSRAVGEDRWGTQEPGPITLSRNRCGLDAEGRRLPHDDGGGPGARGAPAQENSARLPSPATRRTAANHRPPPESKAPAPAARSGYGASRFPGYPEAAS
jgi:hypothetical protein